jgi:glycosyltransferase involved in cell wall biosynthesis
MTVRFAYLVPEFPGSTHTFFHRELTALTAIGAEPHVVSTRPPAASQACHAWAAERAAQTYYLWPLSAVDGARVSRVLARAGPRRLARCLRATAFAAGVAARERAVQAALLAPAAKLVAWMHACDLHHVHAHFASSVATLAMLAHELGGVSYSISAHGDLSLTGGNQRNKWRHAAFGIAITDILRRGLRAELGDAAPAQIAIAPMGVEVERFARGQPYVPYDGSGPFRVFSCGRLTPDKGHEYLVRAVAKMCDAGVDVSLRIAGVDYVAGDANKRALEALISSLGVADRVTLLGAVDEPRVRAELEQAHAFALASIAEPLGVATMEAMAMQVPPVVTDAGGVPELVTSGVHGLLVPPRDAGALATALRTLRDDPALCRRLGDAGRARVAAEFHARRSAEVLVGWIERYAAKQATVGG